MDKFVELDIDNEEVSQETKEAVENTLNRVVTAWSPETRKAYLQAVRATFSKNK